VIVVPVIGIGEEFSVVGSVAGDPDCSGRLSDIENNGLALPESPITNESVFDNYIWS
jgi:hypothetical protein